MLQDQLCGVLQVCLVHVGAGVDETLSNNIQQLIIKIFTKEGKVTGGGLTAFHGLVIGLQEKINLSLMGNYVKHAL